MKYLKEDAALLDMDSAEDTQESLVLREERLLQGVLGRIRDVRAGPDGLLYLLNDAAGGVLARLEPAR